MGFKQDRQCTHNMTLRRFRLTIVTVKNQYYLFWVCVCSRSYPACRVHVQYYIVICVLSGSAIFFHSSQRGRFSADRFERKMYILISSTTFAWNISYSEKNLEIIVNVHSSSRKVPVIIAIFWWNVNFSNTFSKNSQIWKFTKIHQVGTEMFLAGRRTDGHDKANSGFS